MHASRRVFVGGVILSALSVAAPVEWGCAVDPASQAPADIVYEGGATPAGVVALLDAPVVTDATQAASFTWTSNGDVFSASQPLTFCWTSVAGASVEPERAAPRAAVRGASNVGFSDALERATEALVSPLFGPERALAQTAPLSGKAYLLVLSTSKNPKLVRVFTTNHDYTPDAATMKKLVAAGGPIQAVVTTAYFNADAITKTGGPFKGNAVSFTVTP